jgi:DnaJ family protein C protein 27
MGDTRTGKSCIIKRFCESRFVEEYIPTIGIDYGVKAFKTHLEDVKANFWDVGGEEGFFDIRNEFYKDTNGAFLVYDVGNRSTFENIANWIQEFKDYSSEEVRLILVANKCDTGKREVSTQEGQAKALAIKAKYFEVSAKTGEYVNEMFQELFLVALSSKYPETYGAEQETSSLPARSTSPIK